MMVSWTLTRLVTLIANAFIRAIGRSPRSLRYRALAPVYVNETYSLMHNEKDKLWFAAEDGRTIMVAEED